MSSSSSDSTCPASLIASSSHQEPLMKVLNASRISRSLIEFTVQSVLDTVNFALSRSPEVERGRSRSRQSDRTQLMRFVSGVLIKAEVTPSTLFAALVYIHRAKPYLMLTREGRENEHVFLGALIIANKYCNDAALKNIHWAICSGFLSAKDVGRIEREFLEVLDFDLGISDSDLLLQYHQFIGHEHPKPHATSPVLSPLSSPQRPVSPCWSSSSGSCYSEDDRTLFTPEPSPQMHPAIRVVSSTSSNLPSHRLPISTPPLSPSKDSHRMKLSSTVSRRLSSVFGALRAIRS